MIRERKTKYGSYLKDTTIANIMEFAIIDVENDDVSILVKQYEDDKNVHYIQYLSNGTAQLWTCNVDDTFNILDEDCCAFPVANVKVNCDVEYDRLFCMG